MNKFLIYYIFFFSSCVKKGEEPKQNIIFHDQLPKFVTITPYQNQTFQAYDILNNGKTYLAFNSSYIFFNFRYLISTSVNSVIGSGDVIYRDQNFNVDTNFVVEILDTIINKTLCNQPNNFCKFFELTNYGQSVFYLSPFQQKNFSKRSILSAYFIDHSCTISTYYYNLFSNYGYFIFRVRNKKTNNSLYGWAKVRASTTSSTPSQPVLIEIAINNSENIPIAPGYF